MAEGGKREEREECEKERGDGKKKGYRRRSNGNGIKENEKKKFNKEFGRNR